MKVSDLLRPALRQFRTQRLQVLLICIAVALGVGVVVAVAALTEASNQSAAEFSTTLAAREIKIRSSASGIRRGLEDFQVPVRRVADADEQPLAFVLADLEYLRTAIPGVKVFIEQTEYLMPPGVTGIDGAVRANRVTADYFAAAGLELIAGSFFAESDYEGPSNALVVTRTFLEERQVTSDPLSQSFEFQGSEYTIVGVVEDPDLLYTQQTQAYLPLTSMHVRPNNVNMEITAVAESADDVLGLLTRVDEYAQNRWGDKVITSSAASLAAANFGTNTTLLLIAGFASLGLLIAALNIMNLMLARVLKRNREIGIQRSLGASRRLIATQVLLEALVLGAIGGLLGLAAGYGLLYVYHTYLDSVSGGMRVTTSGPQMRLVSSLLGVGLGLVVSLVFGLYPAAVATRVKPVTALRSL